ncbi:DUF1642 domain-containing protein [Companilactobacillus zhachilii]|uniref:DUF1642 domain-containing protein n=1 Tax=Companilactobacillus zhachilii TaxID=2304606 RepID=UPI0040343BC7
MRILKGYSKEERKELEEAKDNGFDSAFDVIYGIIKSEGDLAFIVKKYDEGSSSDNDQLAKDIVDFYCGNAKFPEQKYYIKMPKVNYPYLIRDMVGKFDYAQSPDILGSGENSFTEQEIKDIDPRYMLFAVPVEADNE